MLVLIGKLGERIVIDDQIAVVVVERNVGLIEEREQIPLMAEETALNAA